MQLYFIRHGESQNNRIWTSTNDVVGRSSDPLLTEAGEQQAQRVAEVLARPYGGSDPDVDFHNTNGFGITHLYCSLMTRAVQTGQPIARALGLPLVGLPSIHEHRGIYNIHVEGEQHRYEPLPGPNRSYFEAHFPELSLPDGLQEDGWWRRRTETPAQMWQRAEQAFAWLGAQHSAEDRVAIISHGGFYQALLNTILQVPAPSEGTYPNTWFNINNCAITRINVADGFNAIVYTNKITHLPPDLHTR